MDRVLIVGLPRSGTTWAASMLTRTEEAVLVHEPDNHFTAPFALHAKLRLRGGFYPALAPGDRAPRYERLWREAFAARPENAIERLRRRAAVRLLDRAGEAKVRRAFSGGGTAPMLLAAAALAVPDRPHRDAPTIVVKSVYAPRAAAWIAARLDARVVVVERDLRNVLSSWVELGWLDETWPDELEVSDPGLLPAPPADASRLGRLAWLLALLERELESAAAEHPDWIVVRHEELAARPREQFPALAERLGLPWTADAEAALAESDRPGSGYEIRRVAAELPEVWRTRLAPEQASEIEDVLGRLPPV